MSLSLGQSLVIAATRIVRVLYTHATTVDTENLDDKTKTRIKKRAEKAGRSLLRDVLGIKKGSGKQGKVSMQKILPQVHVTPRVALELRLVGTAVARYDSDQAIMHLVQPLLRVRLNAVGEQNRKAKKDGSSPPPPVLSSKGTALGMHCLWGILEVLAEVPSLKMDMHSIRGVTLAKASSKLMVDDEESELQFGIYFGFFDKLLQELMPECADVLKTDATAAARAEFGHTGAESSHYAVRLSKNGTQMNQLLVLRATLACLGLALPLKLTRYATELAEDDDKFQAQYHAVLCGAIGHPDAEVSELARTALFRTLAKPAAVVCRGLNAPPEKEAATNLAGLLFAATALLRFRFLGLLPCADNVALAVSAVSSQEASVLALNGKSKAALITSSSPLLDLLERLHEALFTEITSSQASSGGTPKRVAGVALTISTEFQDARNHLRSLAVLMTVAHPSANVTSTVLRLLHIVDMCARDSARDKNKNLLRLGKLLAAACRAAETSVAQCGDGEEETRQSFQCELESTFELSRDLRKIQDDAIDSAWNDAAVLVARQPLPGTTEAAALLGNNNSGWSRLLAFFCTAANFDTADAQARKKYISALAHLLPSLRAESVPVRAAKNPSTPKHGNAVTASQVSVEVASTIVCSLAQTRGAAMAVLLRELHPMLIEAHKNCEKRGIATANYRSAIKIEENMDLAHEIGVSKENAGGAQANCELSTPKLKASWFYRPNVAEKKKQKARQALILRRRLVVLLGILAERCSSRLWARQELRCRFLGFCLGERELLESITLHTNPKKFARDAEFREQLRQKWAVLAFDWRGAGDENLTLAKAQRSCSETSESSGVQQFFFCRLVRAVTDCCAAAESGSAAACSLDTLERQRLWETLRSWSETLVDLLEIESMVKDEDQKTAADSMKQSLLSNLDTVSGAMAGLMSVMTAEFRDMAWPWLDSLLRTPTTASLSAVAREAVGHLVCGALASSASNKPSSVTAHVSADDETEVLSSLKKLVRSCLGHGRIRSKRHRQSAVTTRQRFMHLFVALLHDLPRKFWLPTQEDGDDDAGTTSLCASLIYLVLTAAGSDAAVLRSAAVALAAVLCERVAAEPCPERTAAVWNVAAMDKDKLFCLGLGAQSMISTDAVSVTPTQRRLSRLLADWTSTLPRSTQALVTRRVISLLVVDDVGAGEERVPSVEETSSCSPLLASAIPWAVLLQLQLPTNSRVRHVKHQGEALVWQRRLLLSLFKVTCDCASGKTATAAADQAAVRGVWAGIGRAQAPNAAVVVRQLLQWCPLPSVPSAGEAKITCDSFSMWRQGAEVVVEALLGTPVEATSEEGLENQTSYTIVAILLSALPPVPCTPMLLVEQHGLVETPCYEEAVDAADQSASSVLTVSGALLLLPVVLRAGGGSCMAALVRTNMLAPLMQRCLLGLDLGLPLPGLPSVNAPCPRLAHGHLLETLCTACATRYFLPESLGVGQDAEEVEIEDGSAGNVTARQDCRRDALTRRTLLLTQLSSAVAGTATGSATFSETSTPSSLAPFYSFGCSAVLDIVLELLLVSTEEGQQGGNHVGRTGTVGVLMFELTHLRRRLTECMTSVIALSCARTPGNGSANAASSVLTHSLAVLQRLRPPFCPTLAIHLLRCLQPYVGNVGSSDSRLLRHVLDTTTMLVCEAKPTQLLLHPTLIWAAAALAHQCGDHATASSSGDVVGGNSGTRLHQILNPALSLVLALVQRLRLPAPPYNSLTDLTVLVLLTSTLPQPW